MSDKKAILEKIGVFLVLLIANTTLLCSEFTSLSYFDRSKMKYTPNIFPLRK